MQHVESSQTRDGTRVLCVGRWILNRWTPREIHSVELPYIPPRAFVFSHTDDQAVFQLPWRNHSFQASSKETVCLMVIPLAATGRLEQAGNSIGNFEDPQVGVRECA